MFGDTQEAVEAEAAGGEEDEEELGEVIRENTNLGYLSARRVELKHLKTASKT